MRHVIHNVPIGIGIVRVTCSYDVWDEYQERKAKALKEQVSRGNEPTLPFEEEPTAQLMDLSMAETADTVPYWAASPVVMVPKCPPEAGDHWHVMTAVGVPGFADKSRRSPALLTWDDVMQYLEELTDDGGSTPWVEEHVYDRTAWEGAVNEFSFDVSDVLLYEDNLDAMLPLECEHLIDGIYPYIGMNVTVSAEAVLQMCGKS